MSHDTFCKKNKNNNNKKNKIKATVKITLQYDGHEEEKKNEQNYLLMMQNAKGFLTKVITVELRCAK